MTSFLLRTGTGMLGRQNSQSAALTRTDLREELTTFVKGELSMELRKLVNEAFVYRQSRSCQSQYSAEDVLVHRPHGLDWTETPSRSQPPVPRLSLSSSATKALVTAPTGKAFTEQLKEVAKRRKQSTLQVDEAGNLQLQSAKASDAGKAPLNTVYSTVMKPRSEGLLEIPLPSMLDLASPVDSPRGSNSPREGIAIEGKVELFGYEIDAPHASQKFPQNGHCKTVTLDGIHEDRVENYEPLLVSELTTDALLGGMSRFKEEVMQPVVQEPPRTLTILSGVMVLVNVFCVGLDTNYRLLNDGKSTELMHVSEILFCLFFVGEISIRIRCLGCHFFKGESRNWNIFDLIIVAVQVSEQVSTFVRQFRVVKQHDLTFLRVLRILRIVRVMRLVRVFGLFDQLRQMVDSMVNSVSVLMWSIVMLFLVIYLFSIIFLQCILDADDWKEFIHSEPAHHFFGDLPRTIFTMFECVVGGVNWDDVVSPLMKHISPYLGIVFTVYISFCMFAIMNMLTGVFVEQSMECFKEDKDYSMANQIRDLFLPQIAGSDGERRIDEIDWNTFERRVQDPIMQVFLTDLGLSASDAKGLFHLLDADQSRSLSAEEIVEGCLRLRGPARTLDLALLRREIHEIKFALANTTKSHSPNISRQRESPRPGKGKQSL